MRKFSIWISSMRLRTLPLSISGIILASSFAAYNGYFDWLICVLAILTTLSFQILSNLANDYGDGIKGTDNNGRVGPNRAIQTGEISPTKMLIGIKINVAICFILAFLLIFVAFGFEHLELFLFFLFLGIASVIAAIRYTVGTNAYGYKGLGDVYVFVFFGLVSVIGGYVLYAKTIDVMVLLPAVSIGFLSAAVLNLNNMRDMESDRKSDKVTLVVKIGVENAKKYHILIICLAIVLSGLYGVLYFASFYNLIYVLAYIPLINHIIKVLKNTDSKILDPELKKVALTTFALAILMGVGRLL